MEHIKTQISKLGNEIKSFFLKKLIEKVENGLRQINSIPV